MSVWSKRRSARFTVLFHLVETLENDLEADDFEEGIDEVTGERILKLTAAAATRKGLTDLRDVAFEVYTDPTTGKEQIRMKGGNQTGKLGGDSKFELFFDSKTGQQKIVLKRPKGRTRKIVFLAFAKRPLTLSSHSSTGREID